MSGEKIKTLLDIMARLRDPGCGCPWDRAQTFHSLAAFTLEEAYEVVEAAESDDPRGLCEELGDLLYQVVFYAQLASEAGLFDFDDVVEGIAGKLQRRHPHVFGGEDRIDSVAGQSLAWEAHKAAERRHAPSRGSDAFAEVALALPALTRAVKLQKCAARAGFDWPDIQQVLDKVAEELEELRRELVAEPDIDRVTHEIGDLLLAVSNLARHAGVDPETALRRANRRFGRRYARMAQRVADQGGRVEDASLAELEALWQQVKSEEG